MSRKRRQIAPLVLNQFSVKDVERICSVLNGEEGPELQSALSRLVESWQASGPNLLEMMWSNPALWRELRESWRAQWGPTTTGGAHVVLYPAVPENKKIKRQNGGHEPTLE